MITSFPTQRICIVLLVLFGWTFPIQAQDTDKVSKKVVITTEIIDKDGNKKVERIEKSGIEASDEAIDKIVQDAIKAGKAVDVEVEETIEEDGSKAIRATLDRFNNKEGDAGEVEMTIEMELDEDGNITSKKIKETKSSEKQIMIISDEEGKDIDVDELLKEHGIELDEGDSAKTRIRIIKKSGAQEERADVEEKIKELGITLPTPGKPVANYVNAVASNKLIFMAGKGPSKPDGTYITGKVGKDLSIEEGYQAARLAGIVQLAALKAEIGDLNRVKRIVKVLGMVNATGDFTNHPEVINGFSDLMVAVFGDRGKHARAAVGMYSLPRNIAVEVEMIVEIE